MRVTTSKGDQKFNVLKLITVAKLTAIDEAARRP